MSISVFILVIICIVFIIFYIKYRKNKIRENVELAIFNPEWIGILENNLAIYPKLPLALKNKLHGLINLFIYEKTFSGYNSLEINDEIKVTIASQACLLVLNQEKSLYPYLKNIFVYPSAFKSSQTVSDGIVTTKQDVVRIGESWHLGHVVLSWEHSKQGGVDGYDGHNVVYHEFAHQLDHEDGAIDGTPLLKTKEDYNNWSKVFSQEYSSLKNKVSKNKRTLIDSYGAVSEAEFFAVVTELYFEKPELFINEHPQLYQELLKFYKLNPVEWV